MTGLYVSVAVLAVAHWWSRLRRLRWLEWTTKPAVTALVAVAAVALTPHSATTRAWFVVAFVLCLAGDVFLMLPRDLFIAGLASFLLGHVAFVTGLLAGGRPWHVGPWGVVGLAIPAVVGATVGPRIVAAARRAAAALAGPVTAYFAVIIGMAVVAALRGNEWSVVGASSFVVSDATLGWNRFVRQARHGDVVTMVTYHVALVALLLSLR